MSTFRKAHSVLHETTGTYNNGVWVGGTRSVSSVQMSAQPLNSGQEMEALPEGRHLSETKKFYSSVKLKTTADGENIQPDIVVHGFLSGLCDRERCDYGFRKSLIFLSGLCDREL